MRFTSNKQRKAVMASLNKRAKLMIGDGKLPNKYFVTVSNDYEVYDKKNNGFDFKFNRVKCVKPQIETIDETDDYDAAVDIAEDQLGRMHGKGLKAFPVTSIAVEDRLSGEVHRHSIGNQPYGDNKFSVEEERKLKSKNKSIYLKKLTPAEEGSQRQKVKGKIIDY